MEEIVLFHAETTWNMYDWCVKDPFFEQEIRSDHIKGHVMALREIESLRSEIICNLFFIVPIYNSF